MTLLAAWTRNVAALEAEMQLFGDATTTTREEVVVGGEGRTTRMRRTAELQLEVERIQDDDIICQIKFELLFGQNA